MFESPLEPSRAHRADRADVTQRRMDLEAAHSRLRELLRLPVYPFASTREQSLDARQLRERPEFRAAWSAMTYEDPAARDAYRRGASEALDCFFGHLPPAKARELQEWLRDLTAWKGGTPPLSPLSWEIGRQPEG